MKTIVDKAVSGDKDCAMYLVDRCWGRPRIEVESKMNTNVTLNADRLIQRLREVREREAEILASVERPQPPKPLQEGNEASQDKDDQNGQVR